MRYLCLALYVSVVTSCSIVIVANTTLTPATLPAYLHTQPSCPPSATTVIAIDQTPLASLSVTTFAGFSVLQRIDIQNAGLLTLPATIFSTLTKLTYLSLANNLLTTLPPNLFADNTALVRAHFTNNQLNYLPDNVFSGAPLQWLDLSYNELTGFGPGSSGPGPFGGLGSLTKLELQSNQLRSADVHTGALDDCVSLTEANFKNNSQLVTLPNLFFTPPALLGLNLGTFNLLGDAPLVCSSCGGCVLCRTLTLSCCYRKTIPTSSPTTPKPTSPTRLPTRFPTQSPTRLPTQIPTTPPTSNPTTLSPTTTNPTTLNPTSKSPTRSPSPFPTYSPSTSSPTPKTRNPTTLGPTIKPSSAPTRSPITVSPTGSPVTVSPTRSPVSVSPTRSPVTVSPTRVPVTVAPTRSPVTASPATVSPSSAAPTLNLAQTGGVDQFEFPWAYVLIGIVSFMCMMTIYLYYRRRARIKRIRLGSYLRGDNSGSVEPSTSPMHSEASTLCPTTELSSTSSSTNIDMYNMESHSPIHNNSIDGAMFPDGSYTSRSSRPTRDKGTVVEIPNSEIEVGAKLGTGAFGSVNQCLWRGTDYAMKSLINASQEAAFEKEVEVNRSLSAAPHIHVTRMVGVTSNPAGIVMELYPMGSVEEYLRTNLMEPGDFPQVLTILITASAGVMHLHSQGIIHRDIAARNFLIKKDHSAAICDFGLALSLPEGKTVGQRTPQERETDMLPINIAAPETLNQGQYSAASDVFMFGMFIWEVLARQIPHSTRPEFTTSPKDFPGFIGRVVKEDLRPVVPLDWPPVLRTLILQCWERDPANRPTLNQINITLRACRTEAMANTTPLPASRSSQIVDSNIYYAEQVPSTPPPPYGAGEIYGTFNSSPRTSFITPRKR